MSKDTLSPKQQRFVDEYLIDLNASAAAIRAGYSARTAGSIGWENLKKPQIAKAIEAARERLSRKVGITAERVLTELGKMAFSNIGDHLRLRPDGAAVIDMSTATPDQLAAIESIQTEEESGGVDGDELAESIDKAKPLPVATVVRKTKLKMYSKLEALQKIGVHLGMFRGAKEEGLSGADVAQKQDRALNVAAMPFEEQQALCDLLLRAKQSRKQKRAATHHNPGDTGQAGKTSE